eukprot:2514350-Amphidinium_carterae.1
MPKSMPCEATMTPHQHSLKPLLLGSPPELCGSCSTNPPVPKWFFMLSRAWPEVGCTPAFCRS